MQYSDDLEVYQTNLSMKVIRNKACLEESRFEDDEREGEIARGCWNTNEDGLRKNAKTREQSKDRKDENDIDVYVNHIIDKEANLLQGNFILCLLVCLFVLLFICLFVCL